jgi:predicted RNA-binding protein with PUA-like domain
MFGVEFFYCSGARMAHIAGIAECCVDFSHADPPAPDSVKAEEQQRVPVAASCHLAACIMRNPKLTMTLDNLRLRWARRVAGRGAAAAAHRV